LHVAVGLGTLPAMREGFLIVLEGVDGAGTTTHARLLSEALRSAHVPVHATAEPSTGPIGALLRQMLSGRIVVNSPSGGAPRAPGWATMALLFAADRMDHLESEILPNLAQGVSVVCDRYYHSTVAYQSVAGGGSGAIPWLRECNRNARRPDLTLVLDASAEVAAERRRQRRGHAEIFDADELQRRLCAFYAELERHFPDERIVHVDSNGSVDEVAARVLGQVRAALGSP
jgi:dTMP kinase